MLDQLNPGCWTNSAQEPILSSSRDACSLLLPTCVVALVKFRVLTLKDHTKMEIPENSKDYEPLKDQEGRLHLEYA